VRLREEEKRTDAMSQAGDLNLNEDLNLKRGTKQKLLVLTGSRKPRGMSAPSDKIGHRVMHTQTQDPAGDTIVVSRLM
jgi:hypothetical protein